MARAHEQWWPVFVEKAGHQLPQRIVEIGQSLGPHRGSIDRHLGGKPPLTMIHSDYQAENLMFGANPDTLSVVDWQFVGRGRGIADVAYFLSDSMSIADRQAIEEDLLLSYLQILRERGIDGYTLEEAMHDYRLCLLKRFGSLVSTIAAMPFTPEQIKMHVDVLLPRSVAAIMDHDTGSLP
jgi:thiamine kinase-like enzyme